MKSKTNFPGMDGFCWWTGIVESRDDPLKCGRIQVRIFGWHTEEKNNAPTEELIWAQPIYPANTYQFTHVPKEAEMVFGFFMDNQYGQFPFYFGVIPNIPEIRYPNNKGFSDPAKNINQRPDTYQSGQTAYPSDSDLNQPSTSKLARNENVDQTPLSSRVYNAKYPYNSSFQSESGHYFDIDDTYMHERISLLHRSGSYIEFCPNGDVNLVVSGNFNVKVMKDMNVEVGVENSGDLNIDVLGSIFQTSDKGTDILSKGGPVRIEGKTLDLKASGGDMKLNSSGTMHMLAGGNILEKGAQIHLNSAPPSAAASANPAKDPDVPDPKIKKRR